MVTPDSPATQDKLRAYLRRATADLRAANRKLAEERGRGREPIAVVSAGCRLPAGIADPEALWDVLAAGRDVVGPFPTDRGWDVDGLYDPEPGLPDRSYVREGGFLADAAGFDPAFFGVGPHEAAAMDPQQRLLLETSWEALERAGIDPWSLRGSRTGVFIGMSAPRYAPDRAEIPPELDDHVMTGNAASIASGRLSYLLGLEGPSLTLDTACSSALVALHLAAQSIRAGECDLALAGGATVLTSPELFVWFSRQRGLAPDGRCKAFSARADGTGWAEGVVVVAVETLARARQRGHPVLGVLRGSAVNSDGASNGLTAPSGPAQRRVIAQALAEAGLTAADVDLLEAHGTGTVLGDPIEARAVHEAYGSDRPDDRPLWLGSIKSNLGHTQAAAGGAGLLKALLAFANDTMPATLHADEPTPHADWSTGRVRLLTRARPWPRGDRPRRAAVSAFGISGTNAHVVLEEPPAAPEVGPAPEPAGVVPWVLSARTPDAVREQAERLLAYLDREPGADPVAVGRALAARTGFARRAVVLGTSTQELRAGLDAVAHGRRSRRVVAGAADPGGLAFVYSGQGSQHPGMGRGLYAAEPAYRDELDRVCAELDRHLDRPLLPLILGEPDAPRGGPLDRTTYTQPALFAVQTALTALLRERGVTPDVLLGHSVGELTAAHAAGVLDLADTAALISARARYMAAATRGGSMVAVDAAEDEVRAVLPAGVAVAAVNNERGTVVSGDRAAVAEVRAHFADRRVRTAELVTSHAFHSHHMDAALAPFRAFADRLTYHRPRLPIVSNRTGAVLDDLGADHWVAHIRDTVRFHQGVAHARDALGVTAWLEVGPHPALSPHLVNTLPRDAAVACALHRGQADDTALTTALARLATAGVPVDWSWRLDPPGVYPAAPVPPLPTYPFQRTRHWLHRRARPTDRDGSPVAASGAAQERRHPEREPRLSAAAGTERVAILLDLVRAESADVLGHDTPEAIDPRDSLLEAGLSSLTALEVRNRLCDATGLLLPPTVIFDHPTPRLLAEFLDGELAAAG
ncbi:type I polyketide synthase [Actinokineospora auranticolor]|uniref:Acyl transferase domain-containing protein n=1 Tax=Actinokineospora auranticolor TaxID=155976 RepID=A0A2S6GLR9_9PSEU|nr:type I polyketide synthase [Actinokineospora auranticolor]PPK66167.1 acyl transferase domain-containing protein [Actinokineospora auranticolor]